MKSDSTQKIQCSFEGLFSKCKQTTLLAFCKYILAQKLYLFIVHDFIKYKSSHQRYSIKKGFSKVSQNCQKSTFARVFFSIKLHNCNFIKKGTLAQVFSCKFCEIFKNTYIIEHLRATASGSTHEQKHAVSLSCFIEWNNMELIRELSDNFFVKKFSSLCCLFCTRRCLQILADR